MKLSKELPSGNMPYNFKELSVTSLRPKHMTAFSESVLTENLQPAIEALGETIDADINVLTFGDFYFLMLYHRFHSRNIPFPVAWNCLGAVIQEVATNKRYTYAEIKHIVDQYENAEDKTGLINPNTMRAEEVECAHANRTTLDFSDFEIVHLSGPIEDSRFDFPRVKILSEYADLQRDVALQHVASVAAWLRDGETLRDKIHILTEQEDFVLFDAATEVRQKYDHGVARNVSKKCAFCGEAHQFNVMIGPQSFFA